MFCRIKANLKSQPLKNLINFFQFILAVLVTLAVAAPEPPAGGGGEFDPEDLMSGKNPDPVLLTRVTGIYTRAGPDAAERLIAQNGGGNPGRSTISAAVRAAGNAEFMIDDVQNAPLLDEFDFPDPNVGGGQGGFGRQSGGYNGPPPAARSYGPPATGGYQNRY